MRNAQCNNSEDNLFWIRCIAIESSPIKSFSSHLAKSYEVPLITSNYSIVFGSVGKIVEKLVCAANITVILALFSLFIRCVQIGRL